MRPAPPFTESPVAWPDCGRWSSSPGSRAAARTRSPCWPCRPTASSRPKAACPRTPQPLSYGWLAIILGGSAIVAYLVLGIAYNKKVRELGRALDAMRDVVPADTPAVDVQRVDARKLELDEPVDLVVTSPPYPGIWLADGDRLREDWFPVIWRAAETG